MYIKYKNKHGKIRTEKTTNYSRYRQISNIFAVPALAGRILSFQVCPC
jgi:hypothetical protein